MGSMQEALYSASIHGLSSIFWLPAYCLVSKKPNFKVSVQVKE